MQISNAPKIATAASAILGVAQAVDNPQLFRVAGELTHALPYPFFGNLTLGFAGGVDSDNDTVISQLSSAQQAAFISYDDDFDDLIGSASLETIVANTSLPFTWAGEGGIWIPDLNQVWLTRTTYLGPSTVYILYLDNNTVVEPKFKAAEGYGSFLPLANPAGGYYFDGMVYMATTGNEKLPAALVGINPYTWEATPLVNSYFGLELPAVDDIAVSWTNTSAGLQKHVYFSTLDLKDGFDLDMGRPPAVLPNGFWMFTPGTNTLQPVIPRSEVMTPNGVAIDRHFKHLYVTDTSATARFGGGFLRNSTTSPAIYRYDLSEEGLVSNKVLLGFSRQGISDGIKVDDEGRIWTAEYEGIVARNRLGKVIGIVNKQVILGGAEVQIELANFAIAGDTLVILAVDKIQTVKFTKTLISKDRFYLPAP